MKPFLKILVGINYTPCSALTLKPEGFEYSLF